MVLKAHIHERKTEGQTRSMALVQGGNTNNVSLAYKVQDKLILSWNLRPSKSMSTPKFCHFKAAHAQN